MTVKAFVSRYPNGRPWPPTHEQETGATCGIIQNLWASFHHEQILYAALVNLRRPNADLVLLNERGIGVIELKHSVGRITCHGGVWYADDQPIKAGSREDILTPRAQVQEYARHLRHLVAPLFSGWWGLPEQDITWRLHVQTAVCF